MARNEKLPNTPGLPNLAVEVWEEAGPAERRIEAWRLAAHGYTQAAIARELGVSRTTVAGYLAQEAKNRLSRTENTEAELEHIIGTLEAVVQQAWESHRAAFDHGPQSLAASNYLRLVLDAAREIARLRGFDALVARRGDTSPTRAEIVVRIGGGKDFEQVIEVGARVTEP